MKCSTYADIPKENRDLWAGDFPLNPDLHLPAENRFIGQFQSHSMKWPFILFFTAVFHICSYPFTATDFTLKTPDCPDTDFPVKIIDTERGRLWFRKDNKFKIPKGTFIIRQTSEKEHNVTVVIVLLCLYFPVVYARFRLLAPFIQESPKKWVVSQLI